MKTALLITLSTAVIAMSAHGLQCPGDVNGDQMVTVDEILLSVTNALNGCQPPQPRFVDNANGTVTDQLTQLIWEKKTLAGIHDATKLYTLTTAARCDTPCPPNGTAYTDFLAALNNCSSNDGHSLNGGFAGHCDWRLPTIAELQTIVDVTQCPSGSDLACISAIFGPTVPDQYWSSTSAGAAVFWFLNFDDGAADGEGAANLNQVRAVRGGS